MMQEFQAHRDAITSAVATSAVTSPLWLPSLDTIAKITAIVYSMLGAIWLISQMYRAWKK